MASIVFTENPTKSINPLILIDSSSFFPHSQFFVVSLHTANQSSEEIMAKKEEQPATDQSALIAALQKQIQKLEADLKKSQDKNLALNVMIDIAEEQGIRIRKKSGAKQ